MIAEIQCMSITVNLSVSNKIKIIKQSLESRQIAHFGTKLEIFSE